MVSVRVGFDARAAFLDPHRGFGRVTRSLAAALVRLLPGEVVLFVPHGVSVPEPWYPLAARIVRLRRPRRGAFLFDPWAWRYALRRVPVDVLHLPAWTVPPRLPAPVVATFYDATPFRFPSPPQAWRRRRARLAITSRARADRVHALSRHAAAELDQFVPRRRAPAEVVHLGVDETFRPGSGAGGLRHLLFVGGGEPHKNLDLLLDALAGEGAERLPPLLVVGAAADAALESTVRRRGLAARVRLAAPCGDGELAEHYRQALATLVPSRNEGFGLPALEAMACGCPVLAADAGALPEVCGGAGRLLPSDDPAAWRAALLALLDHPRERAALAEAGIARAREFTWERSADGLVRLYRTLVRADSSRI